MDDQPDWTVSSFKAQHFPSGWPEMAATLSHFAPKIHIPQFYEVRTRRHSCILREQLQLFALHVNLLPLAQSSQRRESMEKSAANPPLGLTLPTTIQTRPHEGVFTTAAHMEASFAAEPVKPAVKFSSGGGSVSSVVSAAPGHE